MNKNKVVETFEIESDQLEWLKDMARSVLFQSGRDERG